MKNVGALLLIWGPTGLVSWLALADAAQVRLAATAIMRLLGG